MRTLFISLAAGACGGAAVGIAFWLFESILPQGPVSISLEEGSLATLLALLLTGAVIARRRHRLAAAALFAGSGASWAFHAVHPLSVCQSDSLYLPCAGSEVASLVGPAVMLLVLAAAFAASTLVRTRSVP
jgi:hypothetical protein